MDWTKMIFVTGFARGGTSWLRDCIASHPQVQKIPSELTVFRDHAGDRPAIETVIEGAIADKQLQGPHFVNKAPANAPHVADACRMFPEAKFLFIIRDPRDVFISHKRGKRKWMGGENRTVDGCMKKTQSYFEGYLNAADADNLMLVRYEDLHQDFHSTLGGIFKFLGLPFDDEILEESHRRNNFQAATGRYAEDRDAARRKGVVGDWVNFLAPAEVKWFQKKEYWIRFMDRFGYDWRNITYQSILTAMRNGGVVPMTEERILARRLDPDRASLILLHDIDLLQTGEARQGVLDIARIEGELGLASTFNFLPLDDERYRPLRPQEIVKIIRQVRELSPLSSIGLHLNATERFFPTDAPEVDESHPLWREAISYLHQQIADYEEYGIRFKFGTAHGYGRREREPNNNSAVCWSELEKHGIRMFEDVRRDIHKMASHQARLNDVGGSLAVKRFPAGSRVDDPECYRRFPGGSVIHFLIHPGNYPVHRPLTLGLRLNKPFKHALQVQA